MVTQEPWSLRWIWDENKNRTNRRKHVLGVETGRIISARKATARERRVYEEGDFQ